MGLPPIDGSNQGLPEKVCLFGSGIIQRGVIAILICSAKVELGKSKSGLQGTRNAFSSITSAAERVVLIDGHWQELSFNMHILGSCSTWPGRKSFSVILLRYGSLRWYARIAFLAKSPRIMRKLRRGWSHSTGNAKSFYLVCVQPTWLGKSGLWVILLHHGSRPSILQMAITQQPVGLARSSGCRWTALLVGQPGLGYQSLASQLLGFLCAFSRSC